MKIKLRGETETRRVWLNGEELLPARSQKVKNHSPYGFAWGYAGSGPAQLALAICLELLPEEEAILRYQELKWNEIANIDMESDFDVEIEF